MALAKTRCRMHLPYAAVDLSSSEPDCSALESAPTRTSFTASLLRFLDVKQSLPMIITTLKNSRTRAEIVLAVSGADKGVS